MRLPTVMDLMLKQMEQQPIHPLVLNTTSTVYVDDTIEIGRAKALDKGDQPPVHLALRIAEQMAKVSHSSWLAHAAGPSEPPSRASM